MTGQHTAPSFVLTERTKARVRLPLLLMVTLVGSPLAGVSSKPLWAFYTVFALIYALWALRLTQRFTADRRLGYLLALTDTALLLPLVTWSSGTGMKVLVVLLCAAGIFTTCVADARRTVRGTTVSGAGRTTGAGTLTRVAGPAPQNDLEAAVNLRLRIFAEDRTRFGLVVLRVVRFQEIADYYGEDTSVRLMSAVGRRGLRLLGRDSQRFPLPGGRVAFLFETDGTAPGREGGGGDLRWSDPYDVEGLAMALGRKVCEHLIEGQRVECVVGWASAPVDGLTAHDLLTAAEAGAHSTAAFRRVSGSTVTVRLVHGTGAAAGASARAVPERVARTATG